MEVEKKNTMKAGNYDVACPKDMLFRFLFFAYLGNECFAFHNIKIFTPFWFILHAVIYFTSLSNTALIF